MEFIKTTLFDELMALYSMTALREDADPASIHSLMKKLTDKATKHIPADLEVKEKIHRLLQLFYGDWGFHCDENSYFHSDNLFIDHVLEKRQGMPVTLGAIFLYFAEKLDLPVYPVNFPTQLLLRSDVDGKTAFINPWDGKYISHQELQTWFEGAMGFGKHMSDEHIGVADEVLLISRFRQLVKYTLIREGLNDEALSYINHLLIIDPEDPYCFRDRGIVLAQMGSIHNAIADLSTFMEKLPDDPTAFLVQMQLNDLKQELEENYQPQPVH